MGSFKDSLRTWFYGSGTKAIAANSNVCILDASGNPIGCDTIDRVAAYALNNNDVVDMGLPSGRLWAKKNVGALTETGSGYYFSWGNLTGHSEGSGYDFSQAKYDTTDAASISANLTLAQDAAHANLGGLFRMPTSAEFQELYDNCTIVWTTMDGVEGRLFTSNVNGNTLFFPAAGYYGGTSLYYRRSRGYYWSSIYNSAAAALGLFFSSSSFNPHDGFNRSYGFSVRAVI